jgi:hypothetical protein
MLEYILNIGNENTDRLVEGHVTIQCLYTSGAEVAASVTGVFLFVREVYELRSVHLRIV